MSFRSIIVLGFAFLAVSGPAAAKDSLALDGKGILQMHCASCHAIGATGASPHPEAPVFRHLGRNYEVGLLAEALVEGIMTSHPDMPIFTFTAAEVEDIIAYLESIQK